MTEQGQQRETTMQMPGKAHTDPRCGCGECVGYLTAWEKVCSPLMLELATLRSAPAATIPTKYDSEKPRTELLPAGPMLAISEVFAYGATKYSDYNYLGLAWGRLFGATLRHLWAWWRGEESDAETGHTHLAHAACCVLMLMYSQERKTGADDRQLPIAAVRTDSACGCLLSYVAQGGRLSPGLVITHTEECMRWQTVGRQEQEQGNNHVE